MGLTPVFAFGAYEIKPGEKLGSDPKGLTPLLTTTSALARSAITGFLPFAEELFIRHHRLAGMGHFPVRHIGVVLGQAAHEPHALPQIPSSLDDFIDHHCTVGMAWNGVSLVLGRLSARAFMMVRMPKNSTLITTMTKKAARPASR